MPSNRDIIYFIFDIPKSEQQTAAENKSGFKTTAKFNGRPCLCSGRADTDNGSFEKGNRGMTLLLIQS